MTEPWFWARQERPAAVTRLVCLPYAGGIASAYRTWESLVPRHMEVCPVELPGHGARMSEEPFHRLQPLVHALADALEPLLDRPCALFGHSMGGLVAFELARLLRRRGWPAPCHLFISATPAPLRRRDPVGGHDASDAGLKARLRTLNGTPHEVLENDELMALALPVLRADFAVLETYEYQEEPPLKVPITVFGGIDDRTVRPQELEGWRAQSTSSRVRLLPGDHFFIHDLAPELMGLVVEHLTMRWPHIVRGGRAKASIGAERLLSRGPRVCRPGRSRMRTARRARCWGEPFWPSL
nr:alpha/beta fold hydrolase [Actinoplanes digitatis]